MPEQNAAQERTQVKGVLLVAHNDGLRQRLAGLLEQEGLRTEQASDGVEAITRLGLLVDRPPAALLMPVALPRLDGFQVCALLRQCERFSAIRIVLLTEQDCLVERCRAELAGADALLRQPFRRAELRAALGQSQTEGGNSNPAGADRERLPTDRKVQPAAPSEDSHG